MRLNKKLTVQFGVRWEPFLPGREGANRMNHFDGPAFATKTESSVFVNAPVGMQYPGDKGVPSTFTANSYWKLEPRVGVSWDPTGTGRQVIRAGFGLFYDTSAVGYWEDQTEDSPWGSSIALNSPSGGFTNPYNGYAGGNPFPTKNPPPKDVLFASDSSYLTYPTNTHAMYTNTWNLSYETQPFKDWVFSVSYLGNETTHIWTSDDINPGVYIPGQCNGAPCSTSGNTGQRRVLYLENPVAGAAYSDVFQLNDGAKGSYNALLLKGEHRLSNHYTILGNYTYSHCMSTADFIGDMGGAQSQTVYSQMGERGNCAFDIRQGVNLSAVMESPRLKNRLADGLVGSWKLAPIVVIHSGTWFTPYAGTDNSLTGVGNDRPNIVGNPYVRNLKTLQWLDPSAYVANPLGTFGDASRDSLLGPKSVNMDAVLSREFNIREGREFELRFEAFNLANHANFSNPDNTFVDSTFGVIQGDAGPRILQFAAKLQF
jgi:hypothetical protein